MSARPQILAPAGAMMLAVALLTVSCAGSGTPTTDPARPTDGPRNAAQLYEAACGSCHGPRGEGGSSGVPLNKFSAADRPLIIGAIRHGVGGMPASSRGMSDEQIEALADYVAGLR